MTGEDFLPDAEMQSLRDLLKRLERCVIDLQNNQGSIEHEKLVCLATRSAFIELSSIREIELQYDLHDAEQLTKLLEQALQLVNHPKYFQSIGERLKVIESYAESGRVLDPLDSHVM